MSHVLYLVYMCCLCIVASPLFGLPTRRNGMEGIERDGNYNRACDGVSNQGAWETWKRYPQLVVCLIDQIGYGISALVLESTGVKAFLFINLFV